MVEIIKDLNLERILNDVSQASPEFRNFLKNKEYTAPLGSLARDSLWKDYIEANAREGISVGVERLAFTLHIFPDTQLYRTNLVSFLTLQARKRNTTDESLKVKVDQITIVGEELQQGGLGRHEVIPAGLYRGEQSLLSRSRSLPIWAGKEVHKFYDIATGKFEELIHPLFAYQDQNLKRPYGIVAQEYMDSRSMKFGDGIQQAYHKMLTKLLEKRKPRDEGRRGNEFNYIADKVLSLANFGINFFSDRDKSLVLTADNDFKAMEHFIYDSVLPKYLAQRAIEVVSRRQPGRWEKLGIIDDGTGKLESWARKQIAAGLNVNEGEDRQMTNLIYNCSTGEVHLGYVHPKIRDFVYDETTGLAKSYIAERATKGNLSRNKIAKLIMEADNSQYQNWLREVLPRLPQ